MSNDQDRTVIQDNKINEAVERCYQQSENNEMNILIYHTNTNSNHTAAFHFMEPEAYGH